LIKSELINRISLYNRHLHRHDAERIVNIIFSEITAAMARRDRVELRCFGTFFVKFREGGIGRNPRTGALVSVARKAVVDSSDERNAVCKLSGWRHEAKRFPRPGVKSERNGIQIGLAVGG
jgi:integration host factor subunit beta